MKKRIRKRQIRVGGVKIGGGAPVVIQSMAKVPTSNVKKVIAQTRALEGFGCEIIRVAVKNTDDARAIRDIKRGINIPIVADIHFDHRLALESINSGADKIRLNPGNLTRSEHVEAVVRSAKKAKIPIRIGVNSGSVNGHDLVKPALGYIKLFEELDFHDIIISLKASDVESTVEAYRKISGVCDYPLHLGVTAAGSYDNGVIKSSIGIGSLLLDGIGDTIRVSLTADPAEEVITAKRILSAAGVRKFGPEVISCPTCGRCQVNLGKIVKELELKLSAKRNTQNAKSGIIIAVMGCEVNGPGEAKEADIGVAFGKGSGVMFKKGKLIKKVDANSAIREIMKNI